jgi:putative transposase
MNNHVKVLVSIDFFVMPTVRFRALFVLVVLADHRRRVVLQFNVTEHPTAHWTGQQMIETFSWDTAPKYLLRDRDGVYGSQFRRCVKSLGIEEVLTAPRSAWQNAFVERLIGNHTAGLPGPRHCVERTPSKTGIDQLFQLVITIGGLTSHSGWIAGNRER